MPQGKALYSPLSPFPFSSGGRTIHYVAYACSQPRNQPWIFFFLLRIPQQVLCFTFKIYLKSKHGSPAPLILPHTGHGNLSNFSPFLLLLFLYCLFSHGQPVIFWKSKCKSDHAHFPALISLTLSSPLYTLKLNLLTRVHRPFFDPCFFVRPHLLSLSPALLSSFLVFLWKTQFQPCLRVFKLAITSPWIYCSSNVRMACCHFSDCPFLRNGFLWQPLHCHFLLSLLQSFLTLHYLPLV